MRPAPFAPPVYSALSTPMRESKHSSVSAPPVDTAMFGMSPSLWFFGSFTVLSGSAVSAHCATCGTTICFRHLPTCTTSGMFEPSGAFLIVNLPLASVTATAIGLPV
jgi:hypothetical protein